MKKRILKVLATAGITMIAVVSFFMIDKFIIGAIEAEEKVAAYIDQQYRRDEKVDMSYDWYSDGGYIGENYNYNPDEDIILDGERNDLYRKYFEENMAEIEASMNTNMLIEDYSLITYYDGTNTSTRYDDLFIYGVYNTQPVAEEERVQKGAEIIWDIISQLKVQMGERYNICGLHIDYYDLSGVYRFSINMDKESITEEILIACAKEVSFTDNLAIQEKWEEFSDAYVTFWTMNVDDYKISLMGMEDFGDYQLVLKNGTAQKVLLTYRRYERGNPYEYAHGVFTNILGYSGFYVYEDTNNPFDYGHYYTIVGDELVCIAETTGEHGVNSFIVDVNEDGITEFIHNVTFGGDGAQATRIYYNDGTQIYEGWCDDLLDVEFDNVNYASSGSWYVPEKDVVHIFYWLESIQGFESKDYEIDLEKITFYPFAVVEGKEINKTDIGYSYKELCEMAKAYYAFHHDGVIPSDIRIEGVLEEDENIVQINHCESSNNHRVTLEYYEIDRITGTGINIHFEKIDFTGFASDSNSNSTDVAFREGIITLEDVGRKTAYIAALEKIQYERTSPVENDKSEWTSGVNGFAIYDVDLDGEEELLIEHNSDMADSKLFIYDYDEVSCELRKIFAAYPAIKFYENGIIKAEDSHNQTSNEFWPYSLYRYDEVTDDYEKIAYVTNEEQHKEVSDAYIENSETIEIFFMNLPQVWMDAEG